MTALPLLLLGRRTGPDTLDVDGEPVALALEVRTNGKAVALPLAWRSEAGGLVATASAPELDAEVRLAPDQAGRRLRVRLRWRRAVGLERAAVTLGWAGGQPWAVERGIHPAPLTAAVRTRRGTPLLARAGRLLLVGGPGLVAALVPAPSGLGRPPSSSTTRPSTPSPPTWPVSRSCPASTRAVRPATASWSGSTPGPRRRAAPATRTGSRPPSTPSGPVSRCRCSWSAGREVPAPRWSSPTTPTGPIRPRCGPSSSATPTRAPRGAGAPACSGVAWPSPGALRLARPRHPGRPGDLEAGELAGRRRLRGGAPLHLRGARRPRGDPGRLAAAAPLRPRPGSTTSRT